MEDNCPPTPLHVRTGRNSKSPNQMTVSSPDSDGIKSPSGRLSPDSRCVICLGKLQKKSFTDSCLHQFCFQCLLQWSKVKPECPLCKQPFKSIIHNVRSNFDYDQYHIERREPAYVVSEILRSYDFDLVPVDRRFRYRSTMSREYFRELAESFLTRARSSYHMPNFVHNSTFHIQPSARFSPVPERRGARGASDFRRRIYEQDLWVQDLADITGRYRECSPHFYRENPAQIHRIIPWLNREINSLMNDNESYTAYVLDRMLSLLPQYSIRSREFRNVVEPYFGSRTDHFIHEFYTFARSVYDITGFDQNAVYVPNPNYSTEVQEISSSNDDSDVEVIGTLQQKNNSRSRRYNLRKSAKNPPVTVYSNEPVPGPSGINTSRPTETIEVGESDNDDIKVIEYIKPEPEVVTLSSGDEEISFPNNRGNKSVKKNCGKNSEDSLSECSDFPSTQSKWSNNRSKKSKNRGKNKCQESETKGKTRHSLKHRYIRSSSSSSSKSWSPGSRESSGSSRMYGGSRYSESTTSIRSYPSSSSVSIQDGSSSDYEPTSRAKRKKLSNKREKKTVSRKHQSKNHGNSTSTGNHHSNRKNKVKSCVVVPRSNETNTKNNSGEGSHNYPDPAEYSVTTGNENEDSSLPSYWSLVLNNNTENTWKRKRSKERKVTHGSGKRTRQEQEEKPQILNRKEKSNKKISGLDNSCLELETRNKTKHSKSVTSSIKSENASEISNENRLLANNNDQDSGKNYSSNSFGSNACSSSSTYQPKNT